MAGGGGSDTTTTTVNPPAFQLPFLQKLFSAAETQFNNPDQPSFFPGSTVAGFDPATILAQNQLTGPVSKQVQDFVNQMASTSTGILQGNFLDPSKDPNLQATLDAAARPLQQTLTEQILPNIRSGAVANRSVGGSRQGIAEGLAAGRTQQAIGDTTAGILNTNRANAMEQITQALALAPQTGKALTQPQRILDAVGQQKRNLEQAKIDEAIQRFNFDQTAEDRRISQFASVVSGPVGSATEQTGVGTKGPSRVQGALGGAATGAAIGAAFGGYGAPIGAAVGALAGYLATG